MRKVRIAHDRIGAIIVLIVAAILTPTPDVVNQLLMAGPLVVLYEISIGAVALFARRPLAGFSPKAEENMDADTAPPPGEEQQ